ncbi:MAG: HAD-IA family hydrolase [bacterium]
MNKKPIKIIFFDLDGTLVNSIPPAIVAIQAMMNELGYPPKSVADINKYVGFGENPLVAGAIGSQDKDKIEQAKNLYFELYKIKLKEIPLYPHIKEFLEAVKGKIMIIVSNKGDALIHEILENHGIACYFSQVLGGDSSLCLKPDPCAILDLLKKHQISPKEALMIGDMTVDIKTGQNAGILTCAVTYGFDDREKLEELKPDFLVDDLLELLPHIS